MEAVLMFLFVPWFLLFCSHLFLCAWSLGLVLITSVWVFTSCQFMWRHPKHWIWRKVTFDMYGSVVQRVGSYDCVRQMVVWLLRIIPFNFFLLYCLWQPRRSAPMERDDIMVTRDPWQGRGQCILVAATALRSVSYTYLVVAMVLDHHFRSGSRSNPNHWQIGGPGCQWTQTFTWGTVRWLTLNPFELGGLSAGHPAGPSIDSIKALAFAVCEYYLIKIAFSTTKDMFLDALQIAISINLESIFYICYIAFLHIVRVNNSVMNAKLSVRSWLANMQQLKLLTLCWRSFSGCGREHVAVVFAGKGCQYLINGCQQPIGT